jgi:class 3 adenylate cyclase
MAEHRDEVPPALRVRIGVHEAEATRAVDDYSGRGVHEAARIAALARGGEVLSSVRTLESAGSRHRSGQPRWETLRGLSDPVMVATVTG